jgi:uncharacterized RDD family membrane protein YckC
MMEQSRGKDTSRPKSKYFWDSQKLAWVEADETPSQEVSPEVVEAEEEEEPVSEENLEEEVAIEAIAEPVELQYRGVWPRLGGALVDLVILIIVGLLLNALAGLPSYTLPIYGLLYFVGFWTWRGQTPGKMLIGARVVRKNGRPIDPVRAFVRYFFYLIPFFGPITYAANMVGTWLVLVLALIGLVAEGLNREKQGIHDFIAGTVVINSRIPVSEPAEVAGTDTENQEPDSQE